MKKLVKSGADRAFAKYGAARVSHPKEFAALKHRIESLGGKIVWQKANTDIRPVQRMILKLLPDIYF